MGYGENSNFNSLKSHHFVYLRALIVRDILRSKDAQCNSEESPSVT